ncbi:zinc-ribbon domain-containing protein [Ruficoccus amylovorans]|uniref:Zinc-ribbon domain-containing protein n=1 Tax=Ruficoccus amylovorans TaxID=1804625 RepID=A0A842HCV0_9BACT|nr:zinc-ribbon domain-containing protein [Ruficoccus amylovorans]MBC2593427.1 zinc-ribbon domain-containing protein [Ruficoccus amylovorans]
MYSVKPGRGPSLMGGVGGIVAAVFGIIWTIGAASMGAPVFFTAFGAVFVLAALGMAAYNFFNATSKNRLSNFDITSGHEEHDPLAQALGYERRERHPHDHRRPPGQHQAPPTGNPRKYPGEHCPFCGAKVEPNFDFCPRCGKDI